MTTLEKVNEVSIFAQYESTMTFLKAMGYKTNELTVSQMASLKLNIIGAIESTDLRDENELKVMTPTDEYVMSKLGA
jgi:hypothetical protein